MHARVCMRLFRCASETKTIEREKEGNLCHPNQTLGKSNNQNCLTSLMDAALSKGIFGVPTFVFDEEIFWGSEKLELIKARATGDYSTLI